MELAIIIAVVVVALVFDYTNGFHDAANAIATSVSTRALTPRVALAMAAIMNFVGAFLGQKVATTVSDTIDPGTGSHALVIVMAGLLGAIAWNLITWWYGLPSSSSHALIGGLVGAALAAGVTANWDVVVAKVVIPMLLSPLVAFSLGFLVMVAIMWGFASVGYRGSHIKVDLFVEMMPTRLRRFVDMLAWSVLLLFTILLSWKMYDRVASAYRSGEATFDLRLPAWPFLALICAGAAVSIVTVLARIVIIAAGRGSLDHFDSADAGEHGGELDGQR